MSNADNKRIKVGISIGDPNGIGVEVILKALQNKEILDFFTPIIFGSTKLMSYQKNVFDLNHLYFQGIFKASESLKGKINVVNLWKDNINIDFGKPTEESSEMARSSLMAATTALKNKEIDVLVTAPINKDAMQNEDFKFPGHTEFLEHHLGGNSLMLLENESLRVALVTQHIPISEVSKNISKKLIIQKAQLLHETLIKDFQISKPKIAVLALNPHAGDNGLLGTEEIEIISPAIKQLFENQNILAFGPFSADSFFTPNNLKEYDAVLAMYHDQGLIPFKTLAFENGVNFTAGLPFVRTSPDHGTGYSIAGQGIADETSFKQAIFDAIDIFETREEYLNLKKNALGKINIDIDTTIDEDLPLEEEK